MLLAHAQLPIGPEIRLSVHAHTFTMQPSSPYCKDSQLELSESKFPS
jgi:hypothetical protein